VKPVRPRFLVVGIAVDALIASGRTRGWYSTRAPGKHVAGEPGVRAAVERRRHVPAVQCGTAGIGPA